MVNGAASPTVEQEAIDVAARAIADAIKDDGIPGQITLSNGIVLRLKKVPREAIKHVSAKYPEPPVPKVYIEDDDRYEENPNDPDYITALNHRAEVLSQAMSDVCLGLGTEVVSVPDDMQPAEADGWIEDLEVLGIDVPKAPAKARYMAWLRYYALTDDEDAALAAGLPLLMSTIGEEEVVRAMRSFRSGTGGGADPRLPAEQGDPDGPDVPGAGARDRPRNRRARGG